MNELPPLRDFDALSSDAKRVMLSLQRKYAKMREQVIATNLKKELLSQDPNEYYRSLYTREFKTDPSPQLYPYTQKAQKDSKMESTKLFQQISGNLRYESQKLPLQTGDIIQIKQEPPDSPFFQSEFFRTEMCSDMQQRLQDPWYSFKVPDEVNSVIRDHRRSNNIQGSQENSSFIYEHNTGKRLSITQDDTLPKQRKVSSTITQNKEIPENNFPKSEASVIDQQIMTPSQNTQMEVSFNLGFSLEGNEDLPALATCKEEADESAFEASQDLFAITQEQKSRQVTQNINVPQVNSVQIDGKGIIQQRHSSDSSFVLRDVTQSPHAPPNYLKPQNFVNNKNHLPQNRRNQGNGNCFEDVQDISSKEMQDRFQQYDEKFSVKEQTENGKSDSERLTTSTNKKAQSCIESFFQKPSCSIARKLEFNKKIRLMEEYANPSSQNPEKTSRTENDTKLIPKFGNQKKFKRQSDSPSEDKGNKENPVGPRYLDAGLVHVLYLSVTERDEVRGAVLQSKSVCISLVYSDEATLVRSFNSTQAKVKNIAVKVVESYQSFDFTKTFLFACDTEDMGYMTWFRSFMEELMETTNIEKTAINAKQFFIKLFEILDETNKGLTSCVLLDPTIAAWLLNSDKSPNCLQDVLKESGLRRTITVTQGGLTSLNSDLSLLHEMMMSMKQRLQSHNLWELFYRFETRLVPLLALMEMQKLLIDTSTLTNFSSVLKKKLKKLEGKAFSSVGHSFCINSHPRLRQVLYEELRLDEKLPAKSKIAKTSVSHQKSTSESTLIQLKDTHALPAIVLEYRQLQKLKSTYVDGMLSCVRGGYLSTHWDQTAATTGRLTSSQPNIQTIPKVPVTITEYEDNFIIGRTEKSLDIYAREPFICHEGYILLAADFQQIELRLLAHLADDPVLLGIFSDDEVQDIFIELTSQWLGKSVRDISPTEREQTKRIVYSVMYGVGKERLADYLKVSADSAKSIMTSFLMKFPAVNSFTKTCVEFCQRKGFTSTIFKRKRFIPNINHSSYQLRAQAGRQAVNFCVQGSAADLCKAAMLHVQDQLEKHSLASKTRLLAQIHDELLWEVKEECLQQVKGVVREVMEDSSSLCGDMVHLKVPIRISLSTGRSWAHLKPCQ